MTRETVRGIRCAVRLAPSAAILAVLLALPMGARAESAPSEAIEEARAALRDGDAELAIDVLEQARREGASDPALLYELAIAHQQARDYARAAESLAAYLGSEVELDERERERLRGQLADLRAAAGPAPSGDPWADPAVPVIGWSLLVAGILGIVSFAVAAAVAFTIEVNLPEECRLDASLCEPGARDPIGTAWIAGGIGLAVGLVLAGVGGALLAVAGEAQRGASRSLPPDLDPSMQRPFSVLPWIELPALGGAGAPPGGGLSLRATF